MPETSNTAKKAVRFGVEKCYYALLNDDGTYGDPKPLKGAVSITFDPAGETNDFYADNEIYARFATNSGYTGTLNVAYLEDEARVDLLGEKIDAIGGVYDTAESQPKRAALLWQTNGNVRNKRIVFYDTTFSRPGETANTTTQTTDPDTTEIEFAAVPTEMTIGDAVEKVSKYSMPSDSTAGKTVYTGWFENVAKPQAAAA